MKLAIYFMIQGPSCHSWRCRIIECIPILSNASPLLNTAPTHPPLSKLLNPSLSQSLTTSCPYTGTLLITLLTG